jgi:hypothetical protein
MRNMKQRLDSYVATISAGKQSHSCPSVFTSDSETDTGMKVMSQITVIILIEKVICDVKLVSN